MTIAQAPTYLTEAALDLDSLLGSELSSTAQVRSLVILLREGPWDPEQIPAAQRTPLGIVVIDGVLARDLSVAGLEATELVGEGDVLDPWAAAPADAFLPASAHWTVLLAGRILVVDPALMREAGRRPSILGGLYAGSARRAARLALHQAISQLPRVELRLLAMLWHLASRWGRVSADGVVVPLPLSHARLGRLVGARRPTVTLALRELAERGHVVRRDDGAWQLGATTPEMLTDHPDLPRRRRPRPKRTGDAIDTMASDLFAHVRRARAVADQQAAVIPDNLTRLSAARRRSVEVRQESERLRQELEHLRRQRQSDEAVDGDGDGDGDGRRP
jgi:CRP/FNR family cyclic AMP-dependent transcriptional regulator